MDILLKLKVAIEIIKARLQYAGGEWTRTRRQYLKHVGLAGYIVISIEMIMVMLCIAAVLLLAFSIFN